MQMIDVMKRLAELDEGNPNIVNPTAQLAAAKHAPVTENNTPVMEAVGNDLRVLAGVKQKKNLTESTIAECGMMPMGAPMPPTMPASINMSAGNAGEIVAMMRGIMDLAKSDVPSQSMMPTMGAPMPKMMGDLDRDGDHDMDDHDMEKPDGVLTGGPAVSGPTFGDEGGMDDSGADEIADMIKKIKTGEPVKITTDMPVKVTSDEPIKGTTDKLNKVTDTDAEKETYDNSPADPTKVPKFDPNSMADMRNKIDMAEIPPGAPGDNRLPKKKEEESMDPFSAFESKLMSEYKKFVDEATHQAATTMKHVKNPTAGEKKAAKDIKPGVKGYADRVAMLKSAEKDGRLK
jgi:hypothetical protein